MFLPNTFEKQIKSYRKVDEVCPCVDLGFLHILHLYAWLVKVKKRGNTTFNDFFQSSKIKTIELSIEAKE